MEEIVLHIQDYISTAGVFAPIAYIVAMIVAIVISPIPSSPLAIFAGTAFGVWPAFVYTMIGANVGAAIAFYIARRFGRPFVEHLVKKKDLEHVESKLQEHHLTFTIFTLRLLPLPFFDAVSYAAGLTKISFRNFIFATIFGLIPLSFIFSYFGDVFSKNLLTLGGLVVGAVLIFFVVLKYSRLFRCIK